MLIRGRVDFGVRWSGVRTLAEIEDDNRKHPLTTFNRYVGMAVWVSGFAAVFATFLPAETPVVGTLPLAAGIHARIDHFVIQGSLLMLFLNTHSVFEHYISRLECSLLCRLSGSAVYVMHLVAVLWTLLHPYDWLLCIGGILQVRLSVNWQLSVEVGVRLYGSGCRLVFAPRRFVSSTVCSPNTTDDPVFADLIGKAVRCRLCRHELG